MSPPSPPDHGDAPTVAAAVTGLDLDDGGFLLYDPDEEDAWIRSDAPTSLTDWQ